MDNMTINLVIDSVDDEVGQARLVGHKHMPVALVENLMHYALVQDKGYRTADALLTDGWEFCPEGPHWNADVDGDTSWACWTWDFNRA